MYSANFFDEIHTKMVACIGDCKDDDDPVEVFKRTYPELVGFPYINQYARIAYCKPQYIEMKNELIKLLDAGGIISFEQNFEGRWESIDADLYFVAVMEIDEVRHSDGYFRRIEKTPNPNWRKKSIWLDFKIEEREALL